MDIVVIQGSRIGDPVNIASLTSLAVCDLLVLGWNPSSSLTARYKAQEALQVWSSDQACHRFWLKGPSWLDVRKTETWKSGSASSSAVYAAYGDRSHQRQGGILLQVLPPGAITSFHKHEVTREWFYPLVGTTQISNDGSTWSDLTQAHFVEPGTPHTLRNATNDPALNLIHMLHPTLPFLLGDGRQNMADHHYLDR